MTRDELEFQISQYLDGTLGEAARSALEARLAVDAEARAMLDEYRRLDAALKAAPLPAVNWDALSSQISAAVAEQQEEPATTYRIGAFRTMAGVALAACALIGIGFGVRLLQQSQTGQQTGVVAHDPTPARPGIEIVVVDATAASPAQASTQPIEAIVVGPSNALQDRPGFVGFHDDIISRPSEVLVARGGQAAHDATFLP